MKGHVKEARARQAIANCMRKVPQSDGTTLLEFSGVVQEIIDDRAKTLGVKLRHWKLLEDGTFSVDYSSGAKSGTAIGTDINDVLFGVANEIGKTDALWRKQKELEQNNGG